MDYELYYYRALITSVYDGDTVTMDWDYGNRKWDHDVKARLWGIDTLELRGDTKEAGHEAREALVKKLVEVSGESEVHWSPSNRAKLAKPVPVIIRTLKDKHGKFGRILITILLPEPETIPEGYPGAGRTVDNVNDFLVATGRAVERWR